MKFLLIFLVSFVIVYLVYLAIIVLRKKGLEAFKTGKQLMFFKNAYNLNIDKINLKKFANHLSIANAFIIATVVTFIEMFDGLIIKLLIGFVTLIPLMLLVYYILGSKYKKKEGK